MKRYKGNENAVVHPVQFNNDPDVVNLSQNKLKLVFSCNEDHHVNKMFVSGDQPVCSSSQTPSKQKPVSLSKPLLLAHASTSFHASQSPKHYHDERSVV